jgi:hypothetical protein
MKKTLFTLFAFAFIIACNDKKKNDDKMSDNKNADKGSNITYPYKADYSNFSMGDPNHAKLVLDFIKMWEENKLDDMKLLLADSVGVHFNDGGRFMGTRDSLISMGKQFRATMSTVKIRMDAFMPVHSNDKNEDYVLVWETDFITDKTGKTDSLVNHAYFQVKNNKITFWGEYAQKNPPAASNK